jgi:hypothetical protein
MHVGRCKVLCDMWQAHGERNNIHYEAQNGGDAKHMVSETTFTMMRRMAGMQSTW